ncbi:hypothetical protein K1F50_20935, partial [Muricauda oceani]
SASSAIVVNPNIYIAGSEINENDITVAKVWKNGEVLYELSDGISSNSYANDIFVDGDDVYVAGWEKSLNQISTVTAKVWKNGVPTTLSAPAKAESIFVSDGTVYVAGTTDNGTKGAIWKNGVLELLPTENEEVTINSIFIEDNKVYVVGSDYIDDGLRAKQWVDGEVTYLSQTESEAKSVFVSDGTVYVVGSEGNYPNHKATVWVNGDKVSGAAPSYATDIFVENEDIYTSLWFNGDSQIYKNGGLLYDLSSESETFVTSIFVLNGVVYSAGSFYGQGGYYPKYWINDELFEIDATASEQGFSIFVK